MFDCVSGDTYLKFFEILVRSNRGQVNPASSPISNYLLDLNNDSMISIIVKIIL